MTGLRAYAPRNLRRLRVRRVHAKTSRYVQSGRPETLADGTRPSPGSSGPREAQNPHRPVTARPGTKEEEVGGLNRVGPHSPRTICSRWRRSSCAPSELRETPFAALCGLPPEAAKQRRVAHRAGFEPATPRFEVWCSIQLSYRCVCAAERWRLPSQPWRLVVPAVSPGGNGRYIQ